MDNVMAKTNREPHHRACTASRSARLLSLLSVALAVSAAARSEPIAQTGPLPEWAETIVLSDTLDHDLASPSWFGDRSLAFARPTADAPGMHREPWRRERIWAGPACPRMTALLAS